MLPHIYLFISISFSQKYISNSLFEVKKQMVTKFSHTNFNKFPGNIKTNSGPSVLNNNGPLDIR
jgi:hypothetical protein